LLGVEHVEHVSGHGNILAGERVDELVSSRLTMYSTPWCGYCVRLKRALEREGIEFDEVDIEQDPAAADLVMSINGGNATVPTVVLPDGRALTNPPLPALLSAIKAA
jgi:mycoredoxin